MKFIIDEQLPPQLGIWLCEQGHEALHVEASGLGSAQDRLIWIHAMQEQSIIVTKDADFPYRRRLATGPQVLWVRIGNTTKSVLIRRFTESWPDILRLLENREPVVELR